MAVYGEGTIVIRADATKVAKDIQKEAEPGTKRAGRNLSLGFNSEFMKGTKELGGTLASSISKSFKDGFKDLGVLDKAKIKFAAVSSSVDSVRSSTQTAWASTKKFSSGLAKSVTDNEKLKKSLGGTYEKLRGVGTGLAIATAGLGAVGPPLAALTASTAALGAGMFAAQLGVVAFVQAAKPQMEDVTDALTLYEATQENVGQTTKAVKEEQKKYKEALKGMPPAVRLFTLDLIKLKDEYKAWSADLAPDVFKPFRTGINVVRSILPQLSPLVRGVAGVFDEFAQSVLKASKSDEFFTWVADFSADAAPTLQNILETVKNLFVGVIAILHAFAPASAEVSGGLVSMSASFKDWAKSLEGSQGMENFLEFGQQSGPMLKNLGAAFLQILKAMQPFAGSMLVTANTFSVLVANTPAPVIAALAQAFVAASVAARLYAPVATAVKGALDIGGTVASTTSNIGKFTAGLISSKAAASDASGAAGTLGGKVRDTGAALISGTASALKWAAAQTAISVATAASNVKLGIQIAATKTYQGTLAVVRGATVAWTAAQWLLNTALIGNPIGIVVMAIAALVAGVVVAWKTSETFRNVVTSAWNGIKSVVSSVAGWVTSTAVPALSSAWSAIWSALKTVASSISSAWKSVWSTLKTVGSWVVNTLSPWFKTFQATLEFVFKAIIILIKAWWELGVKPVFALAKTGVTALGDVFSWLYNNAVKPAWNGIKTAISAAWTGIKATWTGAIQPALKVLGAGFKSLYDSYVKPAWNSIKSVVSSVWSFLKSTWTGAIQPALKVLGSAFSSLYTGAIKPAWSGIKSAISAGWNGIKPVFSAIKTGVAAVKTAFGTARDGIRTAWNSLEGIAKKPIKFMINTVLNKGLIKAFNWLGSKVGGPHIDNIPLPFATGGVLPGYTPGRDVHQFYSPTGGRLALSGGEAIMRPEFTRSVGGERGVARLNQLAREGKLAGDYASGGVLGGSTRSSSRVSGGVHRYFGGGVVDWIKKQGSKAFDWVGDKASAIYQAFKNPFQYFKSKLPEIPGTGALKDLAKATVTKLVSVSATKAKEMYKSFEKAFNASGGAKFAKMKAWINDHLGIPYLWGGTGPRYDCIAEGTLITTLRGDVPIEEVTTEDQVLTRGGWRRVLRAWKVREDAQLFEIEIGGKTLRGTGDHRVWTENRGWVPLETIMTYDTLVSCLAANELSSMGTPISGTRTPPDLLTGHTSSALMTACTGPSGVSTMVQSRQGTKSTTRTTTRITTTSPTSSSCQSASIGQRVPEHDAGTPTPAQSAGAPSSQWPAPGRALFDGSVISSVGTTITTASARKSGTADVYDLTVEGEHEFFAAGVLVHNCSGFTQAASKAGGVTIPRVAKAQQKDSKRVASSSVRGGDLGFFGNPAHHVLMAMGNGRWAHAPKTGDVTKIASIGSGSFTNYGRTFARGGILPPVFDSGGILPPGISAVRNNTGRNESLIPTNQIPAGDTNISIQLSLEDLAQLQTLDDFLEMLKGTRGRKRRTARSGTVTA